MSRVSPHVTVATIAFIAGLATNLTVNTFGGLAVDKVYQEEVDAQLVTNQDLGC